MWSQEPKMQNPAAQQGPVADSKTGPERRPIAWLGQSVFIKGDVVSAEDLTIDGRLEGTIVLPDNTLTISKGAAIQADLKAHTIIIGGAVTGNVTATVRIEIQETGSVDGNITAPRMAVRDGAVLGGRIDTGADAQEKPVSHFAVAI
jgi:cytoskeletal protein CcmA (bactofilin family)